MITTQPQQESTFLQDLQTGLDQFQSDDKLQSDLLLDGTHLFVGDALTAPGTAIWIGWLGDKDLADLPLRDKAEEVVRICVSQALTLNDDDIDWDLLQRTPRWASHKPTHLLQLMQLSGPADLFFGDEEIWAAEQLQTRFRSNFGLYRPGRRYPIHLQPLFCPCSRQSPGPVLATGGGPRAAQ